MTLGSSGAGLRAADPGDDAAEAADADLAGPGGPARGHHRRAVLHHRKVNRLPAGGELRGVPEPRRSWRVRRRAAADEDLS